MIGYISSTKQTKGQVFLCQYISAVLGIKAKQISIQIILLNSNGSPYLIPPFSGPFLEPVVLRDDKRNITYKISSTSMMLMDFQSSKH